MAETKQKLLPGQQFYVLKEGEHYGQELVDEERNLYAPKAYQAGDDVPLTRDQYNNFRDKFVDPNAKNAPKSSNPAQAKAIQEDAKIALEQSEFDQSGKPQDPTTPVYVTNASVPTETSVAKDDDGTPISAGQVTADMAAARAEELEGQKKVAAAEKKAEAPKQSDKK